MKAGTRLALKAVHRTVGRFLPPTTLAFQVPGIEGRIHVDDQMLSDTTPRGLAHYRSDALSAIDNIEAALARAGRTWADVDACLDLPCGFGRVTRHLARRLDPKRIVACDLDRQAVRFCAAEFGVVPLYSTPDLRALRFPRTYDLIFVGSLLTHLPPPRDRHALETLAGALAPSGVLVFSTQGTGCLEHLAWYGHGIVDARAELERQLAARGVAFAPYPSHDAYGVTLHDRDRLADELATAFPELALLHFAERGWDRHQDVWTYQRRR